MKRPANPVRDTLIEDYARKLSGMKEAQFTAAQSWFRGHYRAVARRKIDAEAVHHKIPVGTMNETERDLIWLSLP